MSKKLHYLFFLLISALGIAQSNYEFTVLNQDYEELTDATVVLDSEWDDPVAAFSLGFDFQVGEISSNTYYITPFSVGGVVSSTDGEDEVLPLIIPIGQDIISRLDGAGNFDSPVSFKIEGATGNRIAKIEWKNAGFFSDDSELDFVNFQLWLYENDNSIEYHYGPSSVNNIADSYEGLGGPLVGLITGFETETGAIVDTSYLLSETPTDPTLVTLQAGSGELDNPVALNATIPSGTVYRFADPSLSTEDIRTVTVKSYPNPTSDFLNIQTGASQFSVSVYSSLGQLVLNEKNISEGIDMSSLESGIYFVSISTTQGIFQKKVIKI